MQLTPNLNLKKPAGTDVVDITDLNENADKLDAEVAKLASATAPGRMSAADKTKLDNATNAATASTLVQRDASGRFKAAAPAAADDVARKQEISDHADVKATTGGGYGHTTLVDVVNSTATDKAATANSVKQAFDMADLAVKRTVSIGNDVALSTVITSGFYRLNQTHPDLPPNCDHGQMIVSRGADTIVQIVKSYHGSKMYVRSGNPPEVGGGGQTWGWYEILTSGGGGIIGALVFGANSGVYLNNNNAGIYGYKSDNAVAHLLSINSSDNVIVGTEHVTTLIYSAWVPKWWNGSVQRDLIHTGTVGSPQSINGSIDVQQSISADSVVSKRRGGAAGGLFLLRTPENTTLTTDYVQVDMWDDHFRIYEGGNSSRGVNIKLSDCAPGASSTIWHSQNSNRVVVSNTIPTPMQVGDVWIDTSS